MRCPLRPARAVTWITTLAVGLLIAGGCETYGPTNPSFDLGVAEAWAELDDMATRPRTPERPVVVLAGINDTGRAVGTLKDMLEDAVGSGSFIVVQFAMTGNFDACRERVVHAVDQAFPNDDPIWTREVDVVAISMGGLIARYAAADPAYGHPVRRLRIHRLFTIGTPHRGATFAGLPWPDNRLVDMRSESEFLHELDAAMEEADYELYPYVRLGDVTVGVANTAPPGETPWWLPNRRLEFAHGWAYRDPRIIADIARRLRGEAPFATKPRAPLPGDDPALHADAQDHPAPPAGPDTTAASAGQGPEESPQ